MKLISSQGQPSKILVVGDYPTANEYLQNYSFSSSAGSLLANLFGPYKINTRALYKTHYYKVPIPGYSSPIKKIKAKAVENVRAMENWDKMILEEIQAISPNVILCMGELALQGLTYEKGISKWRGSILHLHDRFERPKIKVIPTFSPREIWEQGEHPFTYVQWDCGKAARIMEYNERYQPNENIWIAKNTQEIRNWYYRTLNSEYYTLDIETHHGFVTCIGFSHNGTEAFSIPLLVGPSRDYHDRGSSYRTIREILSSKVPKVNQNIKYDWTVLEQYGMPVNNIIGDTMLMAHTIYPEFEKGLGFLNSIYTDLPYYKDEGKKFDPKIHSIDRLLKYNARDALCTWQIWKLQQDDARAFNVQGFYEKNVHPAFFTYKKMDQVGIRVDDNQRKKLIAKYQPQFDELQTTINLIAEETINVNSPTQVGRFVYEILGCPKQTHQTNSGIQAYSTDEDSIEELYVHKISDSGRRKVLRSLILARKIGKVISFLNSPISPDGRMRTSYKLQGTENGRTSAGKSIEPYFYVDHKRGKVREKECGGSYQTIPKHGYEFGKDRIGADLRTIFVPSPGYCFIDGDQSQAEDRVVCTLADDTEGLAILNKTFYNYNSQGLKDDRHTLTAMLVTGKKFELITKDDRQERGKKPRHAGNLGAGAGILSLFTHLPIGICKDIMEKFHATNPKIRGVFHATIRDLIDRVRFLLSPHGRRRDFFGRVGEDMYKQAFSFIPQATVSDHTKFTIMAGLTSLYKEPDMYPIAESHDSFMAEVRLELREAYVDNFQRLCRTPIDFRGCSIPRDYQLVIPGDVTVYLENWGEASK